MKLAWEKTVTQEAPINHIIVEIGEAKKPNGTAIIIKPVYNWLVDNLANGKTKSSPFNLEIPNIPPIVNNKTNNNKKFVINA